MLSARWVLVFLAALWGCDAVRRPPTSAPRILDGGPFGNSDASAGDGSASAGDGGALDGGGPDGGAPPDGSHDPCANVACSGHGRCAVSGGQVLCLCDNGFTASGLACVVPVPTPPVVTAVRASPSDLGPSDALTLEAEVTDPDGLGDVRSGVLENEGGAELGVFSAVRPGLWRWTGTPAELLRLTSVQFSGSGPLTLVARFFDAAGGAAVGRTTLTLRCAANEGICGGSACISLNTATDCGGCGKVCPSNLSCIGGGQCQGWVSATLGVQSCDQACGAGNRCTAASVSGHNGTQTISCSAVSPTQEVISYTVDHFICDCSGFNVTPAAGENCNSSASGCNHYSPPGCRSTIIYIRETVSGQTSTEGDTCAPPYYLTGNSLYAGQSFTKTYGLDPQQCNCTGPAR